MPYSVEEFDETRQEAFIETVAEAANVEPYRVTIISITSTAAEASRRLLAQGCEVLFRVRVPLGGEEDRAPPILAALSFETVNTELEKRGLRPALRFAEPARIVRPQRSCAASPINGVHGGAPPTPFVRLLCCCWTVRPCLLLRWFSSQMLCPCCGSAYAVICATPDAAAACCALVCAAGSAVNVRYALAFGAQPPSWNASIWSAELVNAATEEDWLNCGPVFNTTAHQEYLATCQDDDAWEDSDGRTCADYRVGVGDGGNHAMCADPADPPENYADANGDSAWDKCCVCKVYKEVQPLKGKVAVMTAGSCYYAGMYEFAYSPMGYGDMQFYTWRAYRAQLAGASGVVLVRHRFWGENDPNEDVFPYYKIHEIYDAVSNGKKVMSACTVCGVGRSRVFVVSVDGCQVAMPKHAALALRGSSLVTSLPFPGSHWRVGALGEDPLLCDEWRRWCARQGCTRGGRTAACTAPAGALAG